MEDEILALEAASKAIEPNAGERAKLRSAVFEYSEEFLHDIHDKKAYESQDAFDKLLKKNISEEGSALSVILDIIRSDVDTPGLNPASGGHLGYIPGGGIYSSSLADFLADISNRYAGVFYAGPGAVRIENILLEWMADMVGYPKNSGGNLASGGSIANLIAIHTAREAKQIRSQDILKSVIYLSAQVHHSINKSILITGLGDCPVRQIDTDDRFRISTSHLQKLISQDLADGLKPWLVIASAGTTDTGSVDPIEEIAGIAKAHDMWFHLDAAYGAFFALCVNPPESLSGMHLCDSIIMDPHKGLFLPYGLGAVLIKDKQLLYDAHHLTANYLQDALKPRLEESSPADLSPELTKHFRGLRLWLPLLLHGVKPFRAALQEKLLLARYFHREISKIDGFKVGPEPDLSVVTYRYIPKEGDPNEFNKQLLKEVLADGKVFISSTMLDGKFTLRVAILAFRTHLNTLKYALRILSEKAMELETRFSNV